MVINPDHGYSEVIQTSEGVVLPNQQINNRMYRTRYLGFFLKNKEKW